MRVCHSAMPQKRQEKNRKLSMKEVLPLLLRYTTVRSKTRIITSLMKFTVGSAAYLGNEVSLE